MRLVIIMMVLHSDAPSKATEYHNGAAHWMYRSKEPQCALSTRTHQWAIHTPGLSETRRIFAQPCAGTDTTSRRTQLCEYSDSEAGWSDVASTQNTWPAAVASEVAGEGTRLGVPLASAVGGWTPLP